MHTRTSNKVYCNICIRTSNPLKPTKCLILFLTTC